MRTEDGALYASDTASEFVANLQTIAANGDKVAVMVIYGHGSHDGVTLGDGTLVQGAGGVRGGDKFTYRIEDSAGSELLYASPVFHKVSIKSAYFFSCNSSSFAKNFSAVFNTYAVGGVGQHLSLVNYGKPSLTYGLTESFRSGAHPHVWLGNRFGNPNFKFNWGSNPAETWRKPGLYSN